MIVRTIELSSRITRLLHGSDRQTYHTISFCFLANSNVIVRTISVYMAHPWLGHQKQLIYRAPFDPMREENVSSAETSIMRDKYMYHWNCPGTHLVLCQPLSVCWRLMNQYSLGSEIHQTSPSGWYIHDEQTHESFSCCSRRRHSQAATRENSVKTQLDKWLKSKSFPN